MADTFLRADVVHAAATEKISAIHAERERRRVAFLESWRTDHNRYCVGWLKAFLGPPLTLEDARKHFENFKGHPLDSDLWSWYSTGWYADEQLHRLELMRDMSENGTGVISVTGQEYADLFGSARSPDER